MTIDARRVDIMSYRDVPPMESSVNSDIFPLTPAESTIVSKFFNAIEHCLDVEFKLINALKPGASKQARSAAKQVSQDAAYKRLKASAVAFCAQMILSGLENRMNLLNLYSKLEKELRKEAKLLWELVNDFAMKEAMQKITTMIDRQVQASAPNR